ncbi:MAG: PIN domain-containing protein [bacterium]
MKIYLDVCCLCRPFDDQTQDRIRIESNAILAIIENCRNGKWNLIGSNIIDFEISKIPDEDKKEKVNILVSIVNSKIPVNAGIEERSIELEKLNFYSFDALHIACAEYANSYVLLTADDYLLKKAKQNISAIKIKIDNPVIWLMEIMKNEY